MVLSASNYGFVTLEFWAAGREVEKWPDSYLSFSSATMRDLGVALLASDDSEFTDACEAQLRLIHTADGAKLWFVPTDAQSPATGAPAPLDTLRLYREHATLIGHEALRLADCAEQLNVRRS
jgi:hypothetical protein